jgi:prepilin-type N-terminal cleavage/methylation domain-containing protein
MIKDCSGFTFIELSIVMIIGGIIISILVGVVPLIFVNDRVNETREVLSNMDYVLQGYLSVNKRLPCPDTNGNGQENRNDNSTSADFTDDSCLAYQGNLPYVTLGIVSDKDVWKNRLYYGVYEDLIQTDNSSFCGDLEDFITAAATIHEENPGESDKLHVTSRAVSPNPSINMAYVIISGGLKDLNGSDTRFDGFNSSALSHQFECEERFVEDDYDDIVKTRSLSYLYGKLCTGNQWWE